MARTPKNSSAQGPQSAAPVEDEATPSATRTKAADAPDLGTGGMVRWLWTQITSMRTALVLLFLLAVAAIPGSLIPQYSQSAIGVTDFKRANPGLDKIYEPLGLYHVYSSVWFSAIYLLLFVSLIGCIIPRISVYARGLRNPPPSLPKRLDRLPEWGTATTADAAPEVLDRAESWLKAKHFRVRRTPEGISAERGYLRELGNLVFHLSLVFVLVGVAVNTLWGFKGSAMVVEGQSFANNTTQYDEFHAGVMVNTDDLPQFVMKLNSFTAKFETGKVQRGAARVFEAKVDVTSQGSTSSKLIEVNHPLTVQGMRVHLLAHGYAANVVVKDGEGKVSFSGPVIFLPQDGNFSSMGTIKAPDARPEQLGFEGYFLPTAVMDSQGPRSVFPDTFNPAMFLNVWYGAPRTETGVPSNVYVLDKTGMTQLKDAKGNPVAFELRPGESYTLPDGKGTIEFVSVSRWTKLQMSRAPGLPLAFGAIALAVVGLCFSLFIRPRRLFIRVRPGSDSGSLAVEIGGLDRADSRTGLADDVVALLQAAVPQPPDASTRS